MRIGLVFSVDYRVDYSSYGNERPEAAVSISAAVKNTAENNSAAIAIGNIPRKQYFERVLLILGITAVIVTIPVQLSTR